MPNLVPTHPDPDGYPMAPEERYHHDPDFRSLVDAMENYIRICLFSPTELRQGAILAAVHYAQKTIRSPFIFSPWVLG